MGQVSLIVKDQNAPFIDGFDPMTFCIPPTGFRFTCPTFKFFDQ
jgi:hypothetical protein